MKRFLILTSFICLYLHSYSNGALALYKNDLDSNRDSINWINENTSLRDTINGNHFSRVDSNHQYGLGIKSSFPSNSFGQSLSITYQALFRRFSANAKIAVAISITKGDSSIYWNPISVQTNAANEWNSRNVNFRIPGNLVDAENTITLFVWNMDGNSSVDIDDVQIKFEPLSLIVPIDIANIENWKEKFKTETNRLNGEKYLILLDSINNGFRINSANGDSLISSMKFVIEYYVKRTSKPTVKIKELSSFRINAIDKLGPKTILHFSENSDIANVKIDLVVDNLSGEISFDPEVQFRKKVFLVRAGLAVHYSMNVDRIIKNTSSVILNPAELNYWLNFGNVILAGNNQRFILEKEDPLNTVELLTKSKTLLLNLDCSADHPQLHFPKMKKSKSLSIDVSEIFYSVGDVLKNTLKLKPLNKDQQLVRVFRNPNGYLSSMIWTEHADFSDIRIQRALMFGREDILSADSAIGGFVGNGVPMTKSVFYDNPTKLLNSVKDVRFNSECLSIKNSPEFLELLKQLKKNDFEICLHTPDPFTTTPSIAEEAMRFMKDNFNSVNWIDHGYDNSTLSNREDLNCDGLDSTSSFYIKNLFEKYGVKYAWNSYYEDVPVFKDASFYSFFTNPYSGWNESYHCPEYFRNPLDKNIISWRTTFTLDPSDGSLWSYYFDKQRLNDFVQSNGDCILHTYLARVDSTNGFYSYDGNTIVINPEFEKVLKILKEYSDENKIWLTTVQKMLDFRLLLEKVSIEYTKNGLVIIFNNNDVEVTGFSLITTAQSIAAGEKNIRLKKYGYETIAILNLKPKEKLILDLK